MTWNHWWTSNDPVSQLARVQHDMDRLMTAFRPWSQQAQGLRTGVYPALNLYDDGECLILRAELPGVSPEALDVNVTGDTLTLKGERVATELPEGASYHRCERNSGTFKRAMNLPQQVDPTKVAATFRNGVLDIRLPRADQGKQRKISVKAN